MHALGLKKKIYGVLLHAVFYVIPAKYFKMYIYLTIISLLHKIRFATVDIDKVNNTKFIQMLHVSLNQDVMLFPEYSFSLIWQDDLLNQLVIVDNQMISIKDILKEPKLIMQSLDVLVDKIYNHLPFYDRIKLLGFKKSNEKIIKTDLREVLMFNC